MANDYKKVQSLLKGGPSRPTLFRVEFTPASTTNAVLSKVTELNDYSKYLVKTATLPGMNVVTKPVKGAKNIGVFYEQPIGAIYDNSLTLSFIERSDYIVHKYMTEWVGIVMPGSKQSVKGVSNIHVGYFDDIVSKLVLYKMENGPTGLIDTVRYTFHGVFPYTIPTIPLDSGAVNEIVLTSVSFQYETYAIEYISNPRALTTTQLRNIENILNGLV